MTTSTKRTLTRRDALKIGATTATGFGLTTIMPLNAFAQDTMDSYVHQTMSGEITIHPIAHASFVMKTPDQVIYVDPVGDVASYEGLPDADLILITHEHGDHYNADTLAGLTRDATSLVTNPAVFGMLADDIKTKAVAIANGEKLEMGAIQIEAIPAYNTTAERLNYHPQGRDNGYVLTIDGKRVYIAGDTEDIPEMRALTEIDVAFLPMNLPFTMDIEQAASAVTEFKPAVVYPYHYRGSDTEAFAALVGDASEVKLHDWYA